MNDLFDYDKLKFMCGIEIHQQLSGRKLFCSCPTIIKKDDADFTFARRLRASAGESGKVDLAALHEMQKSKEFEYSAYRDCTCFVELDEEPPHPVNLDALSSAIIAAKLLNMRVVDKVQFMRKTVIDGSNVSGFQRTALIGYDGFIEINNRKIRIDSLCLEEEAAQTIERSDDKDKYNISRLGIPLLEIATAPDIVSPDECRDVAAHLGMILRSLPNCMRGIGSIRQDVNVSIKQGNRVELKGFQDIRRMSHVINKEIKRHLDIIDEGKKVQSEVRKVEADDSSSFMRPMPGADRMYPETDIEPILSKNIVVDLPETLDVKVKRYKESFDLSDDLAIKVVKFESKSNKSFEEIFKKYASKDLSPTNIADFLLSQVQGAEKKLGFELSKLDENKILGALSSGVIAYSSVPDLLKDASEGKIDFKKYEKLSEDDVRKIIKKIISENEGAPRGLLMGKVMASLKGRADGKLVNDFLNAELKK
ncbi:MAG: Glu-tRNA(Gln) amidotransferase subunit GatE [Candidatus Woesearchaeota archaeon]